eukprot:TRINITY_DN32530_c0_g1_i1.p1 TRINITY_DN32530_c0_g1~~TRINITY_DN32530_c0_g1_i1.p1  ORF type:complete len:174 (-),score=12.46 TRINITY_DN32530_c0_g1_i1:2-451(-)
MTHLSVYVCLVAFIGATSAFWTREFDPENVERPVEEYREAYRRHLLERRQEVKCTDADFKACAKLPVGGWDLVTGDAKSEECAPIGEHETESVFYVPDGNKPCCKYHGCVVADCAKLTAEFRYDASKKCTVDNKPTGKMILANQNTRKT